MEETPEKSNVATLEHPPLDPNLEFNITTEWKLKFERGELTTADFEDHWKIWVPHIYSPGLDEDCLSWNFNEDLANKLLFNPLMRFVCNGEPAVVLEDLASKENLSNVCTKVFKMGEPTYSCRECGTDNTCVLCVDCFKYSIHKNHKYKMGTSAGGGCCDCGDEEAWKNSPFCDVHKKKQDQPETNLISDTFKERIRIVFEAVLGYSHRLLTTEQVSDIRFSSSATNDYLFDIDTYCTILYNDEVHTFEQVISTLSRVLKCNQRNAIAFVTSIDREGRAVVKCSDFQSCNELRSEIEKYTSRHGNKPLKVIVSHAHIIAHQIYAMKLLGWLQGLMGNATTFRNVFAQVALKETDAQPCIIKSMLLRDSSLWKSARTHWHRLFISGMLPEYENKKALAKIFTKNYGPVMKDYIRDDHDHTYSIASLSVQLFTTPSIAHHLIEHEDIFFMLLNTFVSECAPKCGKSGKLEFGRNPVSIGFKRAQHILYDLKYLLVSVPETWTDGLRRNFLHGLNCLYNLLSMMQGMDAVTRQVGQHMEYEPEWESAFNLHIKLSYCLSLILVWCGSDKIVLVKAYRAVLRCLHENPCFDPSEQLEVRELADHSTSCLHYDISTQKVSIHQPLTRFFAGLHLYLEKYGLAFDSSQFQGVNNKPTPVELMEPILRTQVLVAQVHAGMWRRNGYGLLNQLFFYQNVKFRTEMYDRDINALQVGASLIESNEFLIHVLNKFNLINWASNEFDKDNLKSPAEDGMMETINLVEEFLHLLIVIVGERHFPELSFVTAADRVKKEIIQHLCIKPLLHSELTKNIPDEINDSTTIDDVINELADFKRGQGSTKGVYELKSQFYDQYNVFYYHYSKEELSKSEVNQRKRRSDAGLLECCPPPQLPKLKDSYTMIVNLLQCDVMLHIFQTILTRCLDLRARSFSESQLHKVLHLIGYGLQEEQSNNYPFFKFVENSNKFKIFQLLEESLTCPRVDAHKDLLKWTINKFKEVANQLDKNAVTPSSESTKIDDTEKGRRAKLAAERRAKIMAQMAALQKNFMQQNAQLFDEATPETSTSIKSSHSGSAMDISEITVSQVALGNDQSKTVSTEKSYTCILCQEEEIVRPNGPVMVLAAFVQESKVLCVTRSSENDTKQELFDANLGPAPHTNTCGHAMHSKCWEQYYEHVTGREHRRPYRLRHPASFDVDKKEYLCPLCECLSNTALPIIPSLNILQKEKVKSDLSFKDYVTLLKTLYANKTAYCHGVFNCDKRCPNEHCDICLKYSRTPVPLGTEGCEARWMGKFHKIFYSIELEEILEEDYDKYSTLFSSEDVKMDVNLLNAVEVFAQVPYLKGTHIEPDATKKILVDGIINPYNWKSLAYSIHSVEMVLRNTSKPLLGQLSSRQRDGVENFIRLCAILSCCPNSTVNKCFALELIEILLSGNREGTSILEWDSFGIALALTYALPSVSLHSSDSKTEYLSVHLPTGGTLESHTLRLVFTAHILKLFLLQTAPEESDEKMETDCVDDHNAVANLIQQIEALESSSAWNRIQEEAIPFLRCCVLFYHYLTEVPAASPLEEIGGDTFSNMCAYLNLPDNPKQIFVPDIMDVVEHWCKHPHISLYRQGLPMRPVIKPLNRAHLIDLPLDYSELINSVSSFTCPKSDHEDARNPTMCLVCGEILCSQSYCCQTDLNKIMVGACNYHAHVCGSDVGIFLRVRDCEILLLASPHRGCFMPAPYLDSYGETDQGLKRGNPLQLSVERYKKLQLLWLNHGILEEIARSLEGSSSHVGATQWHHL